MTNFYFIDTNLIIGYCNPLDRLYDVTIQFFKDKKDRNTFLLFTVQEEFYKKLIKEQYNFINKVLGYHTQLTFPELKNVIQKRKKSPKFKDMNFLKYILKLFLDNKIKIITYSSCMEIFNQYYQKLKLRFDNLVKNWIKKPHMLDHQLIYHDKIYIHYLDILKNHIHDPDRKHLALACYEVKLRNLRNRDHNYFFYTDDQDWIDNKLETCINIKNLFIKKISYEKTGSKKFNPFTKKFDIDLLKYIPNGT